jgi:Ni/Fe-hydrogenase subunit HybB-like protein
VKPAKKLYYMMLVAVAVLGLASLGYRLSVGMKVTALTSYVSWGLWVALYIYFIGLSAGSFLLSTMIYVFNMRELEKVGRLALLSALFALGAGLHFIWVDLGHPFRFWEIFTTPHFTSLMTIESWLYLLYLLLILAELWLLMREDLAIMGARSRGLRAFLARISVLGRRPAVDTEELERRRRFEESAVRLLGIVGIPTAIGVHGGTGAIFAVAIARPYWNGALFPVVFLVSALASGAALVTLLYAVLGPRTAEALRVLKSVANLAILFVALDLLLLASELLVGLYGGIPDHVNVFNAMLNGPYAYVFWVGQLGLAGVVPMVMVAVGSSKSSELAVGDVWGRRVNVLRWISIAIAALIAAGDVLHFAGSRTLTAGLPSVGWAAASAIGFWAAQVVLIAGLVAGVASLWGSPRFWLASLGASIVAGILAVRLNIVIPGFVVPVLEGLESAYWDPRLSYSYFPSMAEYATSLGMVALIVLVFSLARDWLPLFPEERTLIEKSGGQA